MTYKKCTQYCYNECGKKGPGIHSCSPWGNTKLGWLIGQSYDLTAPSINPAVKRFLTSRNSKTVGTVATTAVAIK